MVHFGIWRRVPVGFSSWVFPGCLAIRSGCGYLVSGGGAPLVADGELALAGYYVERPTGQPDG